MLALGAGVVGVTVVSFGCGDAETPSTGAGEPAIVPAGSIVVFSSRTFHRSGPNMTDRYRRCYLAQYSPEPIMNPDGSKLWARAEPVLLDGARVAPPF